MKINMTEEDFIMETFAQKKLCLFIFLSLITESDDNYDNNNGNTMKKINMTEEHFIIDKFVQ